MKSARAGIFAVLCALLCNLWACSSSPLSPWDKSSETKNVREKNVTALGSTFHLRLYLAPGDKRGPEALFKPAVVEILRIARIADSDDARSEISNINLRGVQNTMQISADLTALFTLGRELQTRSSGAFDISFAPIQEEVEKAGPDAGLGGTEDLEFAHTGGNDMKSKVGTANWYFDPVKKQVRLLQIGSKLVVKGIARGYAAQKAAEKLLALKLQGFAVIGGDILVASGSALREPNLMCIEDPEKLGQCVFHLKPLHPERLMVLGMTANSDRPGHVYNPKSGKRTFAASQATISGPDGGWVQGAATAISLMNSAETKRFLAVSAQPRISAVFVSYEDKGPKTEGTLEPYGKVKTH